MVSHARSRRAVLAIRPGSRSLPVDGRRPGATPWSSAPNLSRVRRCCGGPCGVGLAVEIDGGHHAIALNPVDDALRQNEVVIAGSAVLRIPVIGLRIESDRFMDQVVRAHRGASAAAA